MKKVLNSISIFALFMCFNGCEKDQVSEVTLHPDPFTIEQAEALFGTEWSGTISLKSGNIENGRLGIKPDWCDGFTSQNNQVEVVEVGLWVQGRFSIADEASYNDWEATKNQKMIRSLTRMVFLKHKPDGKIDQFLMTIVGDKQYHDNNIGRLEDNSYLNREKHFSGYIYYHDLTGKFVNGWIYEKGELVGKATHSSGEGLSTQIKMATTCITVTTFTLYVICTDWYRDANGNGIFDETDPLTNTTCGTPYAVESNIVYCPSLFTGDGSFGTNRLAPYSGTNGGYDPPVTPTLPPCNCLNVCPVCHKCKDALILKSASTECTPVPVCTCPALPIVDASGLQSNAKADCIYQRLLDGTVLRSFIDRYFVIPSASKSYVGQLNLTWKLGGTSQNGETFPIGTSDNNNRYNSVEIRLNETYLNENASTLVAMTMLHEALHAKLIAEYYDMTHDTDFEKLYSYYRGWGYLNIDANQEAEMLNHYSNNLASALQSFDIGQGINHPLDFYIEAVKYQLANNMFHTGYYQSGADNFNVLSVSKKTCY